MSFLNELAVRCGPILRKSTSDLYVLKFNQCFIEEELHLLNKISHWSSSDFFLSLKLVSNGSRMSQIKGER